MLAATDALDRLFSNDRRVVRMARDLGIAAVHRVPPLKRMFMRQAWAAERAAEPGLRPGCLRSSGPVGGVVLCRDVLAGVVRH